MFNLSSSDQQKMFTITTVDNIGNIYHPDYKGICTLINRYISRQKKLLLVKSKIYT